MKQDIKVLISGGGTGGHIFPAVSIANEIKTTYPQADILFVGALGKMEMEKVPQAGYPIKGIPVVGFHRKQLWRNVMFLPKLIISLMKAWRIIKEHQPDLVVGTGGFASGPILYLASLMGKKSIIQEQNSYAGVTNKILGKRADAICVAYPNMDRFFPKEKIHFTGNPIRQVLLEKSEDVDIPWELDANKPTLLIIGGSLGARQINLAVDKYAEQLMAKGVNVLWQCGKFYYDALIEKYEGKMASNFHILPFIADMKTAYDVSDLLISRAGAGTISELCVMGKATILVPSPNVAEDHQTHNARALTDHGAAVLVEDKEAIEVLVPKAIALLEDHQTIEILEKKIKDFAKPNAVADIVAVASDILKEK
ncbi:undecaprenyldiphospho-muramoylpentapeptide beta-N-acetylglucosaminyltransferase [Halosquirtibacter xylanolyticus]|uniref:undecaprenyldiphospho-muramoylpentapeptide beta-N-acetylglucosaminyltransferase n=1 Tax=Halosquirtibacter xylanolyticus TaxID=3374599 RepID=UPI00374A22CC|nr:undecaprenyldiphospho-muramoylpentapeptide beta-N-acetylglucosaminyltransferase [Prolixibacteraceae bacterium]